MGNGEAVRIPKLVDWDQDGDLDVFATVSGGSVGDFEDELILYENIDGENFINWRLNDALDYAVDVEFVDIDGDEDLDAFVTARDADDLVWLRNDGFQANWVTDTIFPEGNTPLGIVAGDIDGDEDVDVIMCSSEDDKVFGFKNDGSGNFTIFVVDANVDSPREVEMGDINGDGEMDIVIVGNSPLNSVVLYINNGEEQFDREILLTGENGYDLELTDWNGDEKLDIFAGFTDNRIDVIGFINQDSTTFQQDTMNLSDDDLLSIKIADIDRDGDPDLLTGYDAFFTRFPALIVSINENGTIVQHVNVLEEDIDVQRGRDVTGIDVGDINADGKPDIVFADFSRGDLGLVTIDCIITPTIDLGADIALVDGDEIVLDATGSNLTYQWSTGDTTASITVGEAGTYSVTVTSNQGCSATDTVEVSIVTSLDERLAPEAIEIFPNPTSHTVSISIKAPNLNLMDIQLLDMRGKVMRRIEPVRGQQEYQLNVESLSSGLYFIHIQTDAGGISRKLVKS